MTSWKLPLCLHAWPHAPPVPQPPHTISCLPKSPTASHSEKYAFPVFKRKALTRAPSKQKLKCRGLCEVPRPVCVALESWTKEFQCLELSCTQCPEQCSWGRPAQGTVLKESLHFKVFGWQSNSMLPGQRLLWIGKFLRRRNWSKSKAPFSSMDLLWSSAWLQLASESLCLEGGHAPPWVPIFPSVPQHPRELRESSSLSGLSHFYMAPPSMIGGKRGKK
jgi:hypothetical protein